MRKKISSLNSGSEIRIVSPASVVEKDYIEHTIGSLEGLGFKVSVGRHVYDVYHQFSGTDEKRISDFQEALDKTNVKAIFCARGGYGSVRIIDSLDFSQFTRDPKWIVGFSDITVFHSLINSYFELPTLHAPMPVNYSSAWFEHNLAQLNQVLRGNFKSIEPEPHVLNTSGEAKGVLVGGNLSILYSLQATPYEVNTVDKILFIEDVGEHLYHLDRMLNNFRLAGKLQKLKGLIIGGLTSMVDKKRPFGKSAEEIINEYVSDLGIPVLFNFPAGHIENNLPIVLGTEVELLISSSRVSLNYI